MPPRSLRNRAAIGVEGADDHGEAQSDADAGPGEGDREHPPQLARRGRAPRASAARASSWRSVRRPARIAASTGTACWAMPKSVLEPLGHRDAEHEPADVGRARHRDRLARGCRGSWLRMTRRAAGMNVPEPSPTSTRAKMNSQQVSTEPEPDHPGRRHAQPEPQQRVGVAAVGEPRQAELADQRGGERDRGDQARGRSRRSRTCPGGRRGGRRSRRTPSPRRRSRAEEGCSTAACPPHPTERPSSPGVRPGPSLPP